MIRLSLFAFLLFVSTRAQAHEATPSPADCGEMETFNFTTAMCQPLAMAGMPMRMLMVHGNAFALQAIVEKPRGLNAFAVPNMFMIDVGSSLGESHYVNFEYMGTLERWTFPKAGYPELAQIGEDDEDGRPFIDAQHPHSSPIMGLTLSDTIRIGSGKDHVRISFAPRGSSTDGPIAFMHRPTGLVNPDTPLGHHIGQDVGHITSTVLAGLINLGPTTLEISTFNGTEPRPTQVDLPMATPNSASARLIQELTPKSFAMLSAAYVKTPEPGEPTTDHVWRYSASVYGSRDLIKGWSLHRAFIWGLTNGYDHESALNSFTSETLAHRNLVDVYTRIEVLQRTPAELGIETDDPDRGRWMSAVTLGVARTIHQAESYKFDLGVSATKLFLSPDFQPAYGGNPLSARIYLRATGMSMREL